MSPPPEPAARPAGRDPEEKRRRVLAAARSLFADVGYESARVDDIARRARVSKGTVYNVVGSKEELFVRCITDSLEETRSRIAETVGAEPAPGRAIEALIRALLLDVLPSLVGERTLRHQGVNAMRTSPVIRDSLVRYLRGFYRDREKETAELLEQGRASGALRADVNTRDVAILVQAVIDGLVFRAALDPDRVKPPRIAEALRSLLVDGRMREGS